MTRIPLRKRPLVAESKLKEWVELMDPEMELGDLADYSKVRIPDFQQLQAQAA